MYDGIVNSIMRGAANGCLLLGSFWIARHAFRQPRGLAIALGTAVIFWSACTVGLETLGELGIIAPVFMLALGAFVLAAGGFARWLSTATLDDFPREPTPTGLSFCALLCLALVLAAGLYLGIRSLLLAVKVVSDGPIYHLYFAARWWKAGRLVLVAAPFGENAATYFPANGDLWFTWLLASWGGDRLARIGQAPFLALAGLAAYGCTRSLGSGRSAGVIATCWFVSSTPLFIYSFEPNVDTIFVAGYMLATYFFRLGVRDQGDTAAICLGALAAGGALGTKAVGLVFVPPLLLLALVEVLRPKSPCTIPEGRASWRDPSGARLAGGSDGASPSQDHESPSSAPARIKVIRAFLIVVLPLVTGGYWYRRNLFLTGNPAYPLEVTLLGHTFWPGWYGPEAMRQSVYHIPLADWRALGDILLAVVDPRLAPIWVAALCMGWLLGRTGAVKTAARFSRSRYWRRLISSFTGFAFHTAPSSGSCSRLWGLPWHPWQCSSTALHGCAFWPRFCWPSIC